MRKQRRQRGFTLIELLATVAITVVFLAISILAVGSYRSRLKITELDNEARQIYLAAQNRAVLLRSRGALEPLLKDGGMSLTAAKAGDSAKLFYITNAEPDKAEALDQLLPVGTIDPSLREGQFYIVYEPESGSVTDAFYMEDGQLDEGFPLYYATHPASADERRKDDPMVGWYGGDASVAGETSYLDELDVEIKNEDTLRAEITWIVPAELAEKTGDMHLQVTVSYPGADDIDVKDRLLFTPIPISAADGSLSFTEVYLLDSMVTDKQLQFKDLFPGVTSFGGNFTIRAQIEYTGEGYIPHPVETEANSLFADGTDETTAYIEYLRHLQNLDPAFSGVSSSITKAVQVKDVDKPSEATKYILDDADRGKYAPPAIHNFQPISNSNLTSYDGQKHEIRWLYSHRDGNAGLFSAFDGPNKELTDIRLMNADVSGTGNVGALCGEARNGAAIEGCQVYWKAESSGVDDLRDPGLLGAADKTTYALDSYKITGGTVGGLIGYANGVTITNSSASTTVSGATVGGLVGHGESLTIENSYADCYLAGSSAAAGLAGNLNGTNTLQNVYAAGFVSMGADSSAAGLYLGYSWASVHNSYTVMAYSSTDNVYPLAQNGWFGSDVCYLGQSKPGDSAYSGNGAAFTSADKLNGLSGFNPVTSTYAYNLQPDVTLVNYPYPGLEGLDHYGDWLAVSKSKGGRLVYWELYEDGTIGTWGSDGKYLRVDTDPHALVVSDGYALLLDESEFADGPVTVKYKLNSIYDENEYEGHYNNDGSMLTCTVRGTKYYLAELPAECLYVKGIYGNRLRKLYATIDADTLAFSFDPHFAREPIEGDDAPPSAGTGYIRSARHLYDLSQFADFYGERDFKQELDIDYAAYVPRVNGIFGPMRPSYNFISNYDGQYHHIWNVSFDMAASGEAAGLFGTNNGTIKNVLFGGEDSEHVVEISGSVKYMGALAGQSNGKGTIENSSVSYVSLNNTSTGASSVGGLVGANYGPLENCTVGHASLTSASTSVNTDESVCVGGLAGQNTGPVDNCAVGYVSLKSTSIISNAYVGGLAGQTSGTITNCSASTDSITATDGKACGFAGDSSATIINCYAISRIDAGSGTAAGFAVQSNLNISNSYAAADLTGGTVYPFAPNSGDNCYYLDKGEYLNEPFIAPEGSGSAESKTFDELTDRDASLFDPLTDSEGNVFRFRFLDDGSEHRLPAIVKDANGNLFHYGNTVFEAQDTSMGVYYWENEGGDYHFRVVGYDPDSGKYSELINDLCTGHDDGVITDYGYGWFESPALAGRNDFHSVGIDYSGADSDWYKSVQMTAVGTALAGYPELGGYTFHSFPTVGNDGNDGLCLDGNSVDGSGKWTIGKAVFEINPFFANAISYDGSGISLGSEEYPYEIRIVRQLQFINWNSESHDCSSCVDAGSSSASAFPYLGRDLSFRQTHDIDGQSAVFFPIAALRDASGSGNLSVSGVFGGSYDGQSYVIKNIDIGDSEEQANTLGLFGATLDAKLTNIILYSEDGNNTLTVKNEHTSSGWYYAGSLVGLAMQTRDGSGCITNCAAAGFTISDETKNFGRYGGSIGGLVGAANVQISKCTAVNDININYQRTSIDPIGVRAGGLAGACESSITSCYSGGSIKVDPRCSASNNIDARPTSLYIGRIAGGIDIKVNTDPSLYSRYTFISTKNLDVRNSYSYASLPAQLLSLDGQCCRELYNIAGNAELDPAGYDASFDIHTNSVIAENCHYYDKDYPAGEHVVPHDTDCTSEQQIQKQTYSQLSNSVSLGSDFGKIYDQNNSHSPISEDRYKAYPFPAVLKRGGEFVHYGKLPVEKLASASAVMTVDLFADYDAAGGTAYQDDLVWPSQDLASRVPGGQFRPELTQVVNAEGDENAEPVCEAAFVDESETFPAPKAGQRILRVTFLRPGDATVTVFYGQPGADIDDCVALTIPVTDTAELHMQPADTAVPNGGLDDEVAAYSFTGESVTAFTGASMELDLYPFDKNNEPIAPELEEKLTVNVTGFGGDGVSMISAAPTVDIAPDVSETDAPAAIMLDGAAATYGARTMTVDYSYTIEGIDGGLTGSDNIRCEVKDLTVESEPIIFVLRDGAFAPGSVTYGAEDIRFTVDGVDVAVEDLRVTNAVIPTGAVTFTLHEDGTVTAVPGAVSGSYSQEQTQLDLTFTYGPARHSVTVSPMACLYEDGMTLRLEGGDMDSDGSVDLYAGQSAAVAALPDEFFDIGPTAEMTDMPDMAAAVSDAPDALSIAPEAPQDDTVPEDVPTPGVGTPVRVAEYLDKDWTVQWSLEGAAASCVSLAPDGGTAWLAVKAIPETDMTEGTLTVTVTLPEPWLGVTFTGSVPVHIINENAPSPTPEPTPTPVPEAEPVPENTAPPVQDVTPAPPVQEPDWQPEPEPVPDAPDMPDFLPEEEFIPY